MPPKVKVSREEILQAATALVRQSGADALGARTLASVLNCSTQPIFSNFATMEELRLAVVAEAERLCGAYIQAEIGRGAFPAYKASGMAYIRFAGEEKELFKLLYMRNRSNEVVPSSDALGTQMETIVQQNTGLDEQESKLFHLEMWAFVHGIAVMNATRFVELDGALISRMLTDAYLGLRKQYGKEG